MENCISSAALDAARTRLDAAEAARETILLQHIANGVIIDSRTVQIAPDVHSLYLAMPLQHLWNSAT